MSRCSRRCRFSRRAVSNWPCRSASEPGFAPAVAPPPRDSGGEALFPSIEPVGLEAQFLGDDLSGLAALEPVLDRFTFECFIKLTTDFDRCLLHVLHHCFTRFSVRQIGATSKIMGRDSAWA